MTETDKAKAKKYYPLPKLAENARLKNMEEYKKKWEFSVNNMEEFWAEEAEKIDFYTKYEKVWQPPTGESPSSGGAGSQSAQLPIRTSLTVGCLCGTRQGAGYPAASGLRRLFKDQLEVAGLAVALHPRREDLYQTPTLPGMVVDDLPVVLRRFPLEESLVQHYSHELVLVHPLSLASGAPTFIVDDTPRALASALS